MSALQTRITPNLDAIKAERDAAYKSYRCGCEQWSRDCGLTKTEFLKKHGTLKRKLTKTGWRRSWQCNKCLRGIPGDGVNAGPPTMELPIYVAHGHPLRRLVFERRFAPVREAKDVYESKRRAAFLRDHDRYLRTDAWRSLRELVLNRDQHMCTRCHAPAEHVHHLTYERWQHELPEDLTSLCRACHEAEHSENG